MHRIWMIREGVVVWQGASDAFEAVRGRGSVFAADRRSWPIRAFRRRLAAPG